MELNENGCRTKVSTEVSEGCICKKVLANLVWRFGESNAAAVLFGRIQGRELSQILMAYKDTGEHIRSIENCRVKVNFCEKNLRNLQNEERFKR